tara:strand:- start:2266 stop:2664 length:399 start_codon:yes stop_codon:yes gene_type:complete
MDEEKPMLTLVKSRFVGDVEPPLDPAEDGLMQTLSMLCSFHTAEDLASFLFSEMFQGLTGTRAPFVMFEIGVYLDHTKTLDLVSSEQGIIFADSLGSGVFENNLHQVVNERDAVVQLTAWYGAVWHERNRFE